MHGPALTRIETAALLRRDLSKLMDLGVERDRAAIEVGKQFRISPLIVLRLTAGHVASCSTTTRDAA